MKENSLTIKSKERLISNKIRVYLFGVMKNIMTENGEIIQLQASGYLRI